MNLYDGGHRAKESIAWIEGLLQILDKAGYDHISEVIEKSDATEVSRMIREMLL